MASSKVLPNLHIFIREYKKWNIWSINHENYRPVSISEIYYHHHHLVSSRWRWLLVSIKGVFFQNFFRASNFPIAYSKIFRRCILSLSQNEWRNSISALLWVKPWNITRLHLNPRSFNFHKNRYLTTMKVNPTLLGVLTGWRVTYRSWSSGHSLVV